MHRVRLAVRENALPPGKVGTADYVPMVEQGCAWVAGDVDGFAIGDAATGSVWALFVEPAWEGRGLGRALFDAVLADLFARVDRVWLTSEAGTRAERFYRRAGWSETARIGREIRFELPARRCLELRRSMPRCGHTGWGPALAPRR